MSANVVTYHLQSLPMNDQEGDSVISLGPYSLTALTRNGGFVRSASFHEFVDADLRLPSRYYASSLGRGREMRTARFLLDYNSFREWPRN